MTASPNARSDGTTAKRDADGSGFRRELVAGVRLVDLLALAAVPVVLGAVFALPESTRRSLAFAYTDPTVRTAFTAHYVHLDVDHLAGNVAGYVVLAGVGYALAVLAGCRRFFMVALATFLAAFPVVLSALNLAVPRNAISFGFSGINMAFAGLLPLLLGVYARERFFPEASIRALPAVFFPLVGWMAFLALPVSPGSLDEPGLAGLATAVAGILLGLLYASSTGVRIRRALRDGVRAAISNPGYGDLFAIGVALVVGYPVVGFPGDPTGPDSVVNLYVHLLGFCLAFIGPFILLAAGTFEE
ncbi:hypothetical protein [Halorubrum lacusprofundi]|uniref:Rhomboid family protein n=1 Tax=Halorubrum lacusprofundi (strain ATCC 49239 / DSM 5036 / JCM 8891 / ACAM 34) TaxID=416348 RepID=B9LT16_HALLT|nr:hypothetical protein [Halorubrum lacusprofundi]ACM56081.1 hypothetical protein Hlac_0479 [Halorubrum lacusprofundi ATCC 49239]MCG1005608.1 hypothetical protein [Halorubrum lacusprofundi]